MRYNRDNAATGFRGLRLCCKQLVLQLFLIVSDEFAPGLRFVEKKKLIWVNSLLNAWDKSMENLLYWLNVNYKNSEI